MELKNNYLGREEGMKCPICNGKEDTTEHVLECEIAETVYRIKDNTPNWSAKVRAEKFGAPNILLRGTKYFVQSFGAVIILLEKFWKCNFQSNNCKLKSNWLLKERIEGFRLQLY